MYHCKLSIHIVGGGPLLAAALDKTPPPERFSCRFQSFSDATEESLSGCDVLILDLPGAAADLLSRIPASPQVILCADAPELSAVQEEAGRRCADLWLKPFSPAFAAARFGRLLAQLKLRKECWFARTCLDTAMDSVPDLVWFKDICGAHQKVNNAFCHAVGKTKQDVQGRSHSYIWGVEPGEYAKGEFVCRETEEEVLKKKRTCQFDEKVKSKHGLRQFKTYKSPIFDETGEVLGTVGIAHDVTDLENISTELEILLRSMPFAILIKNAEGGIINANEKLLEYFAISRDEIVGRDYEDWKRTVLGGMTSFEEDGYAEAALTVDGSHRTFEIREAPIFDIFETQVGQLCILRDVTVERAMEQQILRNSNTDFMTGLYNRRCFYEYIGKNRGDRRVSLIYLDLDYFKQINDTYGHQTGDEALILTAGLLRENFSDGFIARLGGDEFLITLLGPWGTGALERRAEQLLRRMERAFQSSAQLKILTASIGIAQTDDPAVKIDTLIQRSDMALYAAKQQGRARYCVYSGEADRGAAD